MKDTYSENGVLANKVSLDEGINLAITYDGLLFISGADTVYAHFGYGTKWTNLNTLKMMRTGSGFRANIPITRTGTVHVAFKDSASNWDNNSGSNYSFDVRTKKTTAKD